LRQNLAMVLAAFAGQQRQQREDAGIARRAERQRRQGVRAPAECANDVTEAVHGVEGCIKRLAADRIVDDVEAAPVSEFCDVLLDRHRVTVDWGGAEHRQKFMLGGGIDRKDRCSESARQLHDDMTDAACALDQHLLSGPDLRAINQTFPRGDENQRQRGGFAVAESGRLAGNQAGVDGGKFGERALHAADAAGHAEHVIADLEPADIRSGSFDGAGHVDAEDRRQRLLCMSRLAGSYLQVERIDTAGLDANQHFAGFWDGPRHLRGPESRAHGI
jgi:hypothetical protein